MPGPGTRKLLRPMHRRRFPQIVALTPYIRDSFLAAGFDEGRVDVEGDAVDPSLFRELPARADARARLGLPDTVPIVGYVGQFHTFHEEKGLPTLVRAMSHVSAGGGQQPMLVCVGGPMDRVGAYRELARNCGIDPGRLTFIDRVPNGDVPLWLRALDVAVMPSPSSEYFALAVSPLKLFEYMAAGSAIVASDLPSTRLVLEHGVTGWLVPPDDASALATGIGRLLDDADLSRRLGHAARSAVADITWEARARRILERCNAYRVDGRAG